MRIGFYSHYFVPEIGAPSARVYDLSKQWLAQGHRVQVVTCFPNHPTGKIYPGYRASLYMRECLEGISTHRHWTYITPNEGFIKKTLGHISYLPGALLISGNHVRPMDVAIGTSPTFFAAMAAASEARLRNIPFVMEVRDLWPAVFVELGVLTNPWLIRMLEMLEMALYRRATRIVTVTEAFRQNLISRGVPPHKVATIRNGADVEFWQPSEATSSLRQRLGLEGHYVVLYIGAHGISHALASILDSAQLLSNKPKIAFLFVGEGSEKAQLVAKAEQEGITNVRFLDPVGKEGVRDFYALADVCLVPLRNIPLFDTFIPSKMFEIMSMARPIIGSVRGEAADILRDSGSAVIVEPEDSKAIAGAILELMRDPQRARDMGEQGRRFVVEHYSRAALARTYASVLGETIATYRRKR